MKNNLRVSLALLTMMLTICLPLCAASAATTGPASRAASEPASQPPTASRRPTSTSKLSAAPAPASRHAVGGAAASEPSVLRTLTREQELHLLEARQAQLTLDQAKTEMERAKVDLDETQTLYDEKLVTIDKISDATQKYQQAQLKQRQAEIDLKKKRLDFLGDATLITVFDARKYRGEGGEVMASISLRNDSDLRKAQVVMESGGEWSQQDLAGLLKVDNVIVTLQAAALSGSGDKTVLSSTRAIIGDPFQQMVRELRHGDEVKLEFRLLKKDVENVTVSLEFLGQKREYDVFLKKDSQQDLPDITSTQYSLVGALATPVRYDLNLERLAKSDGTFAMVVLNLPPDITCKFLDPSSKAPFTQVKFTEELSRQAIYLEAQVPEKLDPKLIDASLSFYVLVTKQTELKHIYEVKTQFDNKVPAEEVAKLKANKVELILIPQGVGKLEILVPNSYKEVKKGQNVEVKFNILNSGTLPLRAVTPTLDLPLDWTGELSPKEAEVISGGDKFMFTARINPPSDVTVGEYAMKIKCQGHSGVDVIDAVNKDMNIRLAAESNLTGTIALVAVLVLLVVGIAIASIKISRR